MKYIVNQDSKYKEFLCGSDEEIFNISLKDIAPGSTAYIPKTTNLFILGPDYEWYNKNTGEIIENPNDSTALALKVMGILLKDPAIEIYGFKGIDKINAITSSTIGNILKIEHLNEITSNANDNNCFVILIFRELDWADSEMYVKVLGTLNEYGLHLENNKYYKVDSDNGYTEISEEQLWEFLCTPSKKAIAIEQMEEEEED